MSNFHGINFREFYYSAILYKILWILFTKRTKVIGLESFRLYGNYYLEILPITIQRDIFVIRANFCVSNSFNVVTITLEWLEKLKEKSFSRRHQLQWKKERYRGTK